MSDHARLLLRGEVAARRRGAAPVLDEELVDAVSALLSQLKVASGELKRQPDTAQDAQPAPTRTNGAAASA